MSGRKGAVLEFLGRPWGRKQRDHGPSASGSGPWSFVVEVRRSRLASDGQAVRSAPSDPEAVKQASDQASLARCLGWHDRPAVPEVAVCAQRFGRYGRRNRLGGGGGRVWERY